MCGELLERGADLPKIYEKVMSGKQQKVLNMWGSLMSCVVRNEEYNFLSLFVSYEQFQAYSATLDDLSGVVGLLNRVFECSFALLVVEHESQ